MTMKQFVINETFEFFSKLKINKIEDSEIRNKIIDIYMSLYDKMDDWNKTLSSFREEFFKGNEDKLDKYNAAIQKNRESPEVDEDTKKIISEFNIEVSNMLNKDVEVSFKKLTRNELVEALTNLEIEFTCTDLILLKDFYN